MPLIGRREIPVKRDSVHEWLTEYNSVPEEDRTQDMEAYIQGKLEAVGAADITVDMGDPHGVLTLTQIIMEEINSGSYAGTD